MYSIKFNACLCYGDILEKIIVEFSVVFLQNDERERENVELKDTILWEKFPDGWPKIFVQNVKKDCAGRNG